MQTQRSTLRHIRGACVSADIFINGEAMRSLSMANMVAHRRAYSVRVRPTLICMRLKNEVAHRTLDSCVTGNE